jgi:uncharacterized protein (TIGR02444 family)
MGRQSDSSMQNPLWDYATKIYGGQRVESALLELQDRFGFDVNMLLYAAWLAHSQQRLVTEHLIALEALVGEWRDQVVSPLRAARRKLRGTAGAGELYAGVKALELRAEREQVDRMYAFFRGSEALPPARLSLSHNLQVVAEYTCPGEDGWARVISDLAALITR